MAGVDDLSLALIECKLPHFPLQTNHLGVAGESCTRFCSIEMEQFYDLECRQTGSKGV